MSDNDVLVSHSMFSNAYSYMGLPFSREFRNIDLAVLGIPYDLGTMAGLVHVMGHKVLDWPLLIYVGKKEDGPGLLMPLKR